MRFDEGVIGPPICGRPRLAGWGERFCSWSVQSYVRLVGAALRPLGPDESSRIGSLHGNESYRSDNASVFPIPVRPLWITLDLAFANYVSRGSSIPCDWRRLGLGPGGLGSGRSIGEKDGPGQSPLLWVRSKRDLYMTDPFRRALAPASKLEYGRPGMHGILGGHFPGLI